MSSSSTPEVCGSSLEQHLPQDRERDRIPSRAGDRKDYFNRTYGAWHYTIAPAWDMRLDSFKELLKQLAEKLVKEAA
jgi:hypothetical protein